MLKYGWALVAMIALAACGSTKPQTEDETKAREMEASAVITRFQDADPGMKGWFSEAHGYAIFPTIGKAGMGVGGATGRGVVYEKGAVIGFSRMSQASIGFQLGGQSYAEVIFFKDKAALDTFTGGNFEFSAQASAVALAAGASADANYSHGVAVFTQPNGGLMYEASIGGQKFDYVAK